MFITFEGIEGSGKSTQARRLAALLGPETVLTHEPGGTPLGKAIRELLLDRRFDGMASPAEVLLFFADRAEHVVRLIRPALRAGKTVVSDRYTDSSIAYQGHARGISSELLRAVAELATGGLRPDVTVFLDVPVVVGLARVGHRGAPHDRLESEVREFHERVRNGYLALAAQDPARWLRVDGQGSPDEVTSAVVAAVRDRGLVLEHAVR